MSLFLEEMPLLCDSHLLPLSSTGKSRGKMIMDSLSHA